MELERIEQSLVALEQSLGLSITIIDNQGVFKSPVAQMIFSLSRQSHKKNPVCAAGFCQKCIQHCRYEMNLKCEAGDEVFIETCWKGVVELVAPLNLNGRHLGVLYAGSWRLPEVPSVVVGSEYESEYRSLAVLSSEDAERLGRVLRIFCRGLLSELESCTALEVPQDSRIAQIRNFITDNALTEIGVDDLAAELNLSRSRVSYLLKKYFGKTFLQMVNQQRVSRASILLLGSDDPMSVICRKVGINDEFYFNKLFKKITGYTPGKFREIKHK